MLIIVSHGVLGLGSPRQNPFMGSAEGLQQGFFANPCTLFQPSPPRPPPPLSCHTFFGTGNFFLDHRARNSQTKKIKKKFRKIGFGGFWAPPTPRVKSAFLPTRALWPRLSGGRKIAIFEKSQKCPKFIKNVRRRKSSAF